MGLNCTILEDMQPLFQTINWFIIPSFSLLNMKKNFYLEIVYIISHTFFMHVEDYRHFIVDLLDLEF